MAVTKSICWKQHRHSLLDMCHNLTVLSMDEESKKKFYNQTNIEKRRNVMNIGRMFEEGVGAEEYVLYFKGGAGYSMDYNIFNPINRRFSGMLVFCLVTAVYFWLVLRFVMFAHQNMA